MISNLTMTNSIDVVRLVRVKKRIPFYKQELEIYTKKKNVN